LDFNTVYLEKNELFETLQGEELKSGFLLKLIDASAGEIDHSWPEKADQCRPIQTDHIRPE
jgi:hypothetical protein